MKYILAEAQIEDQETIVVVFCSPQFPGRRTLELYYIFSAEISDVNKFEQLIVEKDFLYFALAEKNLEDCVRQKMTAGWGECDQKIALVVPLVMQLGISSLKKPIVQNTKNMTSEGLVFSGKSSNVHRCFVDVAVHRCCIVASNRFTLSSKGLNKHLPE